MGTWVVPPIAGLVELNVAPEIVAEGIGAISIKNGRVTIYLYDEQMPLDGTDGDKATPVVTAKVVGQLSNVASCIAKLAICLVGFRAPGIVPDEPPKGPRLVKG